VGKGAPLTPGPQPGRRERLKAPPLYDSVFSQQNATHWEPDSVGGQVEQELGLSEIQHDEPSKPG
jgi:hypothetical protein